MSAAEVLALALLAVAGFGAGFVNTVAGAGSLLTLPALIFSGLPADAANATNRVAILVQNAVAIAAFRKSGIRGGRSLLLATTIPAVLASVAGAYVATLLTAPQTQAVMIAAMLIMVALSFIKPSHPSGSETVPAPVPAPGLSPTPSPSPVPRLPLLIAAFTVLGFYGGIIQAGLGILVLLWLANIHHIPLVTSNAVKVVVIGALTVAALALFAVRAETIDLSRGAALSVGTALGAWLGARQAVTRGEKWIRLVVALAVIASAVKLGIDLLG